MILLNIVGGLGNQMFEYSFGKWLQNLLNDELILNTSMMSNKGHDKCLLSKLNISPSVIFTDHYDKSNFNFIQRIIINLYPRADSYVKSKFGEIAKYRFEIITQRFINSFGIFYVTDGYINIHKPKSLLCKNKYVYGYWQSAKYFDKIRNDLVNELTIKTDLKPVTQQEVEEIRSVNSICVHIRRGDYVQFPLHLVCNTEYYLNAIDFILTKVDNPVFYIFTDDIKWVQENIPFKYPVKYQIEKNTSYEELYLMSNCKHFIISNSSFSWWAQYLSNNREKVVVSPSKWYNSNKPTDIYMGTWTVLDV